MRLKIISFLRQHPVILQTFWKIAKIILFLFSKICRIKEKSVLFASFGGRTFDDSPKALYDEICRRKDFEDWNLIWAFVEPDKYNIPRGKKIKIDTLAFFKSLLTSRIWISNSGMDRGINYSDNRIIKIETWHGTPLKKIEGEEKRRKINKGKLSDEELYKLSPKYVEYIFKNRESI